jgi:hypothetical protein
MIAKLQPFPPVSEPMQALSPRRQPAGWAWLSACLATAAFSIAAHGAASPAHAKAAPRRSAVKSRAAALSSISVEPGAVTLHGPRARQPLLVTGHYSDGTLRDLSISARISVVAPRVAAAVDGAVVPRGNGQTVAKVAAGSKSAVVRITVKDFQAGAALSFTSDVVPVLTRAGCNSLSCHGSPVGKAGFKLSMYGSDPALDQRAIARLERASPNKGKRIDSEHPERSLVLLKPTMSVPHQGGLRFRSGSATYETLLGWIRAGANMDPPDSVPRVRRLALFPGERQLAAAGERQRVLVRAEFSDGTSQDVTHQAIFSASDDSIASVDGEGVVTAGLPGETAVLARYLGRVGLMRMMVLPRARPALKDYAGFHPANFIDELTLARWKRTGTAPSESCGDAEFLRRVSLDLIATLPTPDEIRKFLADRDPQRRSKKVEELLARPEFADWWAVYWGEILRNNGRLLQPKGAQTFHDWIRESVAQNKPYDQFVRELLIASGPTFQSGPANFYRVANTPTDRAEQVAQIFLGIRLQCANCHNHPFEKWTRYNYHAFAAFFARVQAQGNNNQGFLIKLQPKGEYINPETRQPLAAEVLGDEKIDVPDDGDRREALAAWMTSSSNTLFARNIVNRLWARFFGKGITEPVDDVRATNPPSNEALLDRLAQDLVAHHFDLKHTMRLVCTSRTYQLSARPNRYNAGDTANFSRAYLRRLGAEQLLDAVCQATNVPENFGANVPRGTRAIQLADNRVASYFLDVFGRPRREVVCVCERSDESNLPQVLNLINGDTLHQKITSSNGRAAELARSGKAAPEIADELYLWTLSRLPTVVERDRAAAEISRARDPRPAIEDRLWVLLNSREFLFNH